LRDAHRKDALFNHSDFSNALFDNTNLRHMDVGDTINYELIN